MLAVVGGMLVALLVSSGLIYLNWSRLPERVQNLPRYVQTQINKYRPHPDFVPTPAVSGAAPVFETALAASVTSPTAPEAATPTIEVQQVVLKTTPTRQPKNSPTPTTSPPTATPTIALTPVQAAVSLSGIRHEYQKWNNCGPVTIGMQLSYLGHTENQTVIAPFLKPNPDDKNVSPEELASYARTAGYTSRVLVGGDLDLLKALLSNGFPVVVESWFIPEPNDEMGHYLLLTGYDDKTSQFIVYDSYHGPDQHVSYTEFDPLWQVFNRTFVLSYQPEQEPVVQALLGERADPTQMYQHALAVAIQEANATPKNKYPWFNIGSSYVGLGDMENAARAFDHARTLQLPWRMLWYQFGPFEAYYALGRYDDVIALTTANLKVVSNLEESSYWRGRAFAAQGNTAAARRDFQAAVRDNNKYLAAIEALQALP
jgi:tetratricopeptide (TPR) repeat protein